MRWEIGLRRSFQVLDNSYSPALFQPELPGQSLANNNPSPKVLKFTYTATPRFWYNLGGMCFLPNNLRKDSHSRNFERPSPLIFWTLTILKLTLIIQFFILGKKIIRNTSWLMFWKSGFWNCRSSVNQAGSWKITWPMVDIYWRLTGGGIANGDERRTGNRQGGKNIGTPG